VGGPRLLGVRNLSVVQEEAVNPISGSKEFVVQMQEFAEGGFVRIRVDEEDSVKPKSAACAPATFIPRLIKGGRLIQRAKIRASCKGSQFDCKSETGSKRRRILRNRG
jgi:hypothetical protein